MDFSEIKELKFIFPQKKFCYFLDKVKGRTLAYAWNLVFSIRQLSARFYCPTLPEGAEESNKDCPTRPEGAEGS